MRTVIIKVGSTFPSLKATRGDFEHWILSGMQIDVRSGARLPEYDSISGIVITGSHAMVTEYQEWSERTAAWLSGAVERMIPNPAATPPPTPAPRAPRAER